MLLLSRRLRFSHGRPGASCGPGAGDGSRRHPPRPYALASRAAAARPQRRCPRRHAPLPCRRSHVADHGFLWPGSAAASTRHDGLTYLIVDMHSSGVEVRPLRQITGEAEFNEIFFEGVDVPAVNVLGEVGKGWDVAMTTLLHERGTLGFALQAQLEVSLHRLVRLARERGTTPLQRDAIAREWIETRA